MVVFFQRNVAIKILIGFRFFKSLLPSLFQRDVKSPLWSA